MPTSTQPLSGPRGINMNFGKTRHAGTRLYVHEDVYEDFLARSWPR